MSFQSLQKNQSLPYINQIQLDISGDTTINSNNSYSWLNLHTFNISNSDDYNTDLYKTYQIPKTALSQANSNDVKNILSKTDKFDVRIYGINYAQNHPDIDTRALIFNDLQFLQANPPSIPQFTSENISSVSTTLQYYVVEPEQGNPTSSAIISEVITDYSQNETLASSIHPVITTNLTDTETENSYANQNFFIILNSLRSGTKYNYKIKAKNNFRDLYSDYSTPRISNFLQLPGNNGLSTSINTNSGLNSTNITTPSNTANLNNQSVLYLNTSTNTTFSLANSNNQIIQITKPYSSNKQNTQKGYGKWVDNSQNLVKVECYINSSLKQTISFHGFNTSNNNAGTSTRTNSNNNTFNYFNIPSQSDIYSTNNSKGFRIKGNIRLNNISSVLTNIGPAQNDKHTIEYKYIRNSDVGGSSYSNIHNIYIDTLPNNPSISANTTTATVKSVIYTMGIPSVKTMDIDFTRTYSNIHSSYKYIPGNRIIAAIKDIAKINKTTDKYIYLARDSTSGINNKIINNTGTYEYTSSEMKTATNSYYYDSYYDEAIGVNDENGNTLNITETVYSLKTPVNIVNTLMLTTFLIKAVIIALEEVA